MGILKEIFGNRPIKKPKYGCYYPYSEVKKFIETNCEGVFVPDEANPNLFRYEPEDAMIEARKERNSRNLKEQDNFNNKYKVPQEELKEPHIPTQEEIEEELKRTELGRER